jgi:hypothetical protein
MKGTPKLVGYGLAVSLFTLLITSTLSTIQVSAQPLVITGTLTDGANISINPEEPLPANGTVSVSTEGVTDTDMNIIPPEGVTVIISNDTATVTNQEVDIATAGGEDEGGDAGDEGGDAGDEGGDAGDEGGDAGDEGDEGDTGGGDEEGDGEEGG